MSISIEQIDNWLDDSESPHLEFKKAVNNFSHTKLCEYCVGISNAGGGHLILGVTDECPHRVVGTTVFTNIASITAEINSVLEFSVQVEEVIHTNGRVVVFIIPSRPRSFPYSYNGKYKTRSGSSLVNMDNSQLAAILTEGQSEWLSESAEDDLNPQQVIDLLDTQVFFELIMMPYPSSREEVLNRLSQYSLISSDDPNKYTISNLCAVLLAKKLEKFDRLYRRSPRVIVYDDTSKISTKRDQIIDKGYAVGFKELIRYIINQIDQNIIIENALRKEYTVFSETSIRELITNAFIHQDFSVETAFITIEVYSDRVEISNPGEPKISVERFIDSHSCRNPNMSDIMRRMGLCEELGSGIDKVINESELNGLPAPYFMNTPNHTTAIIYGPREFRYINFDDRIRACFQHCSLMRVKSKYMTNKSLRERFRLSSNSSGSVSHVINGTIDAGLVNRDQSCGSSKKSARYVPYWA